MLSRKVNRYVNSYNALCEILQKINNHYKNGDNVIELIKGKLEEGKSSSNEEHKKICTDLLSSWKNAGFSTDYEFHVQNQDGTYENAKKLLDIAIHSKYLSVAEALVGARADISTGGRNEFTYLHTAFSLPSTDLFRALMERKVIITSYEEAYAILKVFTSFLPNRLSSQNQENAKRAASKVECIKMLINYMLEKKPDGTMPDFIENNNELSKYWNDCETNIEGFIMINPNTEVQEMSYVGKEMCMIRECSINCVKPHF